MKRALSVASVTALTLLVLLFVGYAQEEGAAAVPLLEQELAAMEAAFGNVQSFMAELVTEVKVSMKDIVAFNGKVDDLRNIVSAVSVEIKTAEGQIIGLRTDVDALSSKHQELKVRVVALEAGLSELSAFCDELKARLDVQGVDLRDLRNEFDALAEAFAVHTQDYEAFRDQLLADIAALTNDIYGDIDALKTGIYGDMDALRAAIYGDMDALGNGLRSDLLTLQTSFGADISMLSAQYSDLSLRIQTLEDEDVGTFKKKVLELERSMAALAIKIDNNRAKLEGFDHAIAGLSADMATTKDGILQANQELLGEYDARLIALEDNADIKGQIDTLYFISIVALLAGVGALIWGFLGTN
jgi:chromosome segregation ATPase